MHRLHSVPIKIRKGRHSSLLVSTKREFDRVQPIPKRRRNSTVDYPQHALNRAQEVFVTNPRLKGGLARRYSSFYAERKQPKPRRRCNRSDQPVLMNECHGYHKVGFVAVNFSFGWGETPWIHRQKAQ